MGKSFFVCRLEFLGKVVSGRFLVLGKGWLSCDVLSLAAGIPDFPTPLPDPLHCCRVIFLTLKPSGECSSVRSGEFYNWI